MRVTRRRRRELAWASVGLVGVGLVLVTFTGLTIVDAFVARYEERAEITETVVRERRERDPQDDPVEPPRVTTEYVVKGATESGRRFRFIDRGLYDQVHEGSLVTAQISRFSDRTLALHAETVDWSAVSGPRFWLISLVVLGCGAVCAGGAWGLARDVRRGSDQLEDGGGAVVRRLPVLCAVAAGGGAVIGMAGFMALDSPMW